MSAPEKRKPALTTPATKPETLDGGQHSKPGAAPSTSPWRPRWRPLAYHDEREGDPVDAPVLDRESETVEERKRRTGYDGAFERPERWAPAEPVEDVRP